MKNHLNINSILALFPLLHLITGIIITQWIKFHFLLPFISIAIFVLLFITKHYKISKIFLLLSILIYGNVSFNKCVEDKVIPESVICQGTIERTGTYDFNSSKGIINISYPYHLRNKRVKIYNYNKYYRLIIGDVISFKGYINSYNDKIEEYYERKGIYGRISIGKNSVVKILKSGLFSKENNIFKPFDTYRKEVFRILPGKYNSLLMSFIFGERDKLSRDTENSFRKLGITHLLALSGLHLAVIIGALLIILKIIRLNDNIILFPMIIVVFYYLAFVDFKISVLRAAFMVFVFMISFKVKRYPVPYNILFSTAFVILLIWPSEIYSPGFLLSFSAVFSIILFYREIYPFVYFKNPLFRYVILPFLISLFINLFTFPIIVHYFGTFYLLSPIANIVFIPLVSLIIVLGVMSMITYIFFPILSNYINSVIFMLEKIFFKILDISKSIDVNISPSRNMEVVFVLLPILITGLFIILSQIKKREVDILSKM